MGKRKHGKSVRNNTNTNKERDDYINAPHSFVIHKGLTGGNVEEITKDFRRVMEPFTASSLKERKNNAIKDFVHVAGALHVSHLCIFSRTELGVYMKLGKMPRGPTLTFKVHNFSLSRDVISSLRKQLVVEEAFKHSPLIVLNNFSGEGMQFKLMASMFQNMFPTLNLRKVDLNTVRRVVMLNYNNATKQIDFRHYTIKVAPVGISKGVKKVVTGKVPDLSKCEDISEFLTKGGLLSESEAEDDPNAHVTLSQKMAARGNIESGKSAIRLSELGPRLTLQLIKIEDGLLDGEVLYHDLVQKTDEEKAVIKKARDAKKKLKAQRKKVQDENTKRKEAAKEELKEKSLQGMKKKFENEAQPPTAVDEQPKPVQKRPHQEDDVEEDDDAQYYREEVGEEPEQDLFSTRAGGFHKPKTFHSYKNKRPRMEDGPSRGSSRGGGMGRGRGGSRGGDSNRGGSSRGGSRGGGMGRGGDSYRGGSSRGGSRGRGMSRGGSMGRGRGSSRGGSNSRGGSMSRGRGGGGNDRDRSFKNKRGQDKTNADRRDFRPIGVKSGIRKFGNSNNSSSRGGNRSTNTKRNRK